MIQLHLGEILTRAGEIAWKNRFLWIFGLLATLAASTSGESGGAGLNFNLPVSADALPLPQLSDLTAGLSTAEWAGIILAALALGLLLLVLSALGRAGLARGAWLADSGEGNLNFRRVFTDSRKYTWRVMPLALVIWLTGLITTLIVSAPVLLGSRVALLCLWPLWCVLIPAVVVLTGLLKLAVVAVTGENLGPQDALLRARQVFRSRILQATGTALALALLAFMVNFFAGLPLALIAVPLGAAILAGSDEWIRGGMAASGVLFLLYLPLLLAIRAALQAYIDTAWVLAFRRFTGRPAGLGDIIDISASSPWDNRPLIGS
jgi:hypothetical protein